MNSEKLITLELAYLGTKTKTVRVFVPEHDDGELLPVIYRRTDRICLRIIVRVNSVVGIRAKP